LIWLFTDLRDALSDQADVGGPSGPDPETVKRNTAIYNALLGALREERDWPDSDRLREYVAELARATDEDNEYKRLECEHRALAELGELFGSSQRSGCVSRAVR